MTAVRRAPVTVLAVMAVAWALLLGVTPLLARGVAGDETRGLAALVRAAAAPICHQRPERSFTWQGHLFPVCGRCLSLYVTGAAALAGVAALAWAGPHRLRGGLPPLWQGRRLTADATWLAMAALPTAALAAVEWTMGDPGTMARAMASAPLGIVVGLVCGVGLARPAPGRPDR